MDNALRVKIRHPGIDSEHRDRFVDRRNLWSSTVLFEEGGIEGSPGKNSGITLRLASARRN
jgi:hypothetical protein